MKRNLFFLLALLLLLSCFGCAKTEAPAASTAAPASTPAPATAAPTAASPAEPAADIRVGSLKGPTTMGLVNLMKAAEGGELEDNYTFTMATDASEIAASLVAGDLDIALIPANLAAVLYNKRTEKGIEVININTLGVLWCITGDENIKSVQDLAGKTVLLTGQGTTPEYSLRYLLSQAGVTDCSLEFRSEATEVAALLAADPSQIAVLPQPFATVAMVQNEALKEAFSLSAEWDALGSGSRMVTGVTVVRKAFLAEHPVAVERFLAAQAESAKKANEDVEGTAALIAEYGIIEKAPVAQKALPKCAVSCITGAEMEAALKGYLQVLFEADPASVGGEAPDAGFYYGKK